MARRPARFATVDGIESKDPIPVRAAIKAAIHRMYKQNLTIFILELFYKLLLSLLLELYYNVQIKHFLESWFSTRTGT